MLEKLKRNKLSVLFGLALFVCLILDFANISAYIPFLSQLNFQFWNLVIVVALFAISYHYIDSRKVKRDVAQEKTGKLLISRACKTCLSSCDILDGIAIKVSSLAGPVSLFGNKDLPQDFENVGLGDLPFVDDQDIKKLAFEGVVNSDDFESYLKLKSSYQSMVTVHISLPDHPEFYERSEAQVRSLAEELIEKLNA